MSKPTGRINSQTKDPLRDSTIRALQQILDPLVDLMFDAGVTVHEFAQLTRERAVRVATMRVLRESGRTSKSRAAIMTGLPRSEVAKILASDDISAGKRLGQHPARKVLTAWFENPRFLDVNGEPAILPIFGRRRSLEQLVSLHSGGIPVRAMLDELTKLGAIERLANQQVKATTRSPVLTGLTTGAIEALGERTRDLLNTLISNLRRSSTPIFEGTALLGDADVHSTSLIRREVAEQGENFINAANALFSRTQAKHSKSDPKRQEAFRLGVTVYFFEDRPKSGGRNVHEELHHQRKNLRRQSRSRLIAGNGSPLPCSNKKRPQ